jgi:ATP-dependent DNA helicase RecG
MIHGKTTEDLIAELNLLDESDAIEAKEVSGNEVGNSIYETICAFSNEPDLGGGVILLGLKKEYGQLFPVYKVTGVKDPDKISNDIVSACQNKFNSPIRPTIKREHIQSKTIVRIEVMELPTEQKPLSIKNLGLPRGVMRRIGSSDVHCSQDDMITFFNEHPH